MAESKAFDFVCSEIERRTSMTRLEARGTVRIALKDAGLAPDSVRGPEMQVVLQRLMPKELTSRGVASAEEVCRAIGAAMAGVREDAASETPEAIFGRLAGAR
jgi:hypothetical protein